MLYQIVNGAVEFGAEVILSEVNFEIRNTEKIAIVGRNGCGKTTLLKLIAGEVDLAKRDSDEDIFIAKSGNPTIGYLKQMAFRDPSITMEEEVQKAFAELIGMGNRLNELLEVMEADPSEANIKAYTNLQDRYEYLGGYTYQKEFDIVLKKFGFTKEDRKKPLSEFSGGQQTKIAFARMLLSKPDILLLDEPTNHLDMDTVRWLEGYLRDYNRAVVVVSHDRYFLDRLADVVYEIEYGTTTRYVGNYTDFVKQKKANWEKQYKDHNLQKKEIERLQALIERFKNKPSKVAMTRSKLKQIEHMNIVEAPARYDLKSFHANFTPDRESYKQVLYTKDLEIGYDKVLSVISAEQNKGQKIAIIGDNGTGKSTFVKTIVGKIPALGGEYRIGANVDIGYFDQQMAQYNNDKTVLEDFWDEFPSLKENEVRSALGAFLFTQEEVFKKINMLSGGEKVRLALCKIFKTKPNYLILDEPTNHMDIVGKETLEAMLKNFTGTVLFVSHDRYFIREVADALLIFADDKVTYYPYGYEEYREEQDKLLLAAEAAQNTAKEEKVQKEAPKYYNPGKEASKIRQKIQKIEKLIEDKEQELAELEIMYNAPENQSAYTKLSELSEQINKVNEELEAYMEEWEDLSSSLPL